MKKLEAIIRSSKFEAVQESLHEVGIDFYTFYEVKGYGHQRSNNLSYRGAAYDMGYIGRIKLDIIVSEDYVGAAQKAIKEAAYTGEKGDGLILITNVEDITNIRTGLKNGESINL